MVVEQPACGRVSCRWVKYNTQQFSKPQYLGPAFLTAICLILKIGTDNLLRRVRAVPTRAAKMRALCSGTDGVYVLV